MNRAVFVPSVTQSSAIDCGPACLTAILRGFSLAVDLATVRDACLTDSDGTSIAALQEQLVALGLQARQRLIPLVSLSKGLEVTTPSIVVTTDSTGALHFEVLWREIGSFYQAMDPRQGRTWYSRRSLASRTHEHEVLIPAREWAAHAASASFRAFLERRLHRLRVSRSLAADCLAHCDSDPAGLTSAALDASLRLIEALDVIGPEPCDRILESVLERSRQEPPSRGAAPRRFWYARAERSDRASPPRVRIRGGLLLMIEPERIRAGGAPASAMPGGGPRG